MCGLAGAMGGGLDGMPRHPRILRMACGGLCRRGSSSSRRSDRKPKRRIRIWGNRRSVTLYAQPRDPSLFAQILEEARVALRILRRLRPNAEDNFDILTPEASRGFLERPTGMIAVAIVPVSFPP